MGMDIRWNSCIVGWLECFNIDGQIVNLKSV